jgi:hypothetical protein
MYKITIEETKTVKKLCGKEWTVIGTKEVEREERFYQRQEGEPKTRIEEVRGYTPEIERDIPVTNTLLVQEIDTLDIGQVIRAINNL